MVRRANRSCKYMIWHTQRPLAKLCTAVWTIGVREKVVELDALQDQYKGLQANLPKYLLVLLSRKRLWSRIHNELIPLLIVYFFMSLQFTLAYKNKHIYTLLESIFLLYKIIIIPPYFTLTLPCFLNKMSKHRLNIFLKGYASSCKYEPVQRAHLDDLMIENYDHLNR